MYKIKKSMLLLCIVVFSVNFSSCGIIKFKMAEDFIVPPKSENQYINGVWKVKDVEILDEQISSTNNKDELMNKSISFCDSMATIGNDTLMNPKTKLKKYDLKHYLLYQYDIDVSKLSLDKNKPVSVISVYQNNNMFCEVIAKDNKNAYIYQSGVLYTVTKISDMKDGLPEVKTDKHKQKVTQDIASYDSPTGVLIGLKAGNEPDKSYRTLWINFDNKLQPVLEKSDIFIPRLKGYSILFVEQDYRNNQYINVTNIMNDSKNANNSENINIYQHHNTIENNKKDRRYVDILFVGNDYLSVQYYEGKEFEGFYNNIRTLPIDNPNNSDGLSISTLGKNALKSYNDSVAALNKRDNKTYKSNPESFGMVRQNGYWALKARINDDKNYLEFDLNMLPTKKLIAYDRLCIGWSSIKDRVPNALDAVTSPNSRIAIIMTKKELKIYEIKNGELLKKPLQTIKLYDDEKIIMAEWATSEFVSKWDKAFKAYGDYIDISDSDMN